MSEEDDADAKEATRRTRIVRIGILAFVALLVIVSAVVVLTRGPKHALDDATALRLYRAMVRVRVLDERMMTLQRQGRIGFYGTCTGQGGTDAGTLV